MTRVQYTKYSAYSMPSVRIDAGLTITVVRFTCPYCKRDNAIARENHHLGQPEASRIPCANVGCQADRRSLVVSINGKGFDDLLFETKEHVEEKRSVPGYVQYLCAEATGMALGLTAITQQLAEQGYDRFL